MYISMTLNRGTRAESKASGRKQMGQSVLVTRMGSGFITRKKRAGSYGGREIF